MRGISHRCRLIACAAAVAPIFFHSGASVHASIVYPDVTGTNVKYLAPTEDSTTDALPLFGAPGITDDSLTFSPPSFAAQSSAGGAPDITDGRFFTTVMALGNARIAHIQLSEAGDYTLAAPPGFGTAATSVSVSAAGFFRITQIDGVGVAPIQANFNAVFTPNAGSYSLPANAGSGVIWTGSLDVDIDAAIAAAGQTGRATQVIFDMDNILTAFSETNTIAKIQKKTVDGVTITVISPEPGSMTLLALAAGAVLTCRRNRRV